MCRSDSQSGALGCGPQQCGPENCGPQGEGGCGVAGCQLSYGHDHKADEKKEKS